MIAAAAAAGVLQIDEIPGQLRHVGSPRAPWNSIIHGEALLPLPVTITLPLPMVDSAASLSCRLEDVTL